MRTDSAALQLYDVQFLCAGQRGSRQVWAPDSGGASRLLRDRASLFGLQHETVLVTRVRLVEIKEAGVAPH